MTYTFPFGRKVTARNASAGGQRDLFVLGAYPSALHVKWTSPAGASVQAVPVDDEPEPFWNGHDVVERTEAFLRWLSPDPAIDGSFAITQQFNGPSGKWVDDNVLAPLSATRSTAWITDCLDTYRASSGVEGRRADLPPFHLQPHPSESEIVNEAIEQHTDRLRAELRRCRPATIATLGNAAARVMAHLLERKPTLVSLEGYGAPAGLRLNGRSVKWFALAHPAAPKQYQASHAQWMKERAR